MAIIIAIGLIAVVAFSITLYLFCNEDAKKHGVINLDYIENNEEEEDDDRA